MYRGQEQAVIFYSIYTVHVAITLYMRGTLYHMILLSIFFEHVYREVIKEAVDLRIYVTYFLSHILVVLPLIASF